MMEAMKAGVCRVARWILKLVYPPIQVIGQENLPNEPCLIVSNHAQANGPIIADMFAPQNHYIWCAGEMMHLKEVPDYAYRDFWSRKPKYIQWFFRLLSYLIAPLSVMIFNSGPSIEVRRDKRVITTFKETVKRLCEGNYIVIFPEHDQPHNQILCDFQDGFVSVARTYYKQTGKEIDFVPMYLAPSLKKMILGKPIRFQAEAPIKEERKRICDELMDSISRMAYSLPKHRVVPYNNIPKKDYPYNTPMEESNEKTSG